MADLFWIILINILCFWAGARWGQQTALLKIIHALSKNPRLFDQVISEYQQQLELSAPEPLPNRAVTVEQIGAEYYVFARDSHEFLAQAHSRDQALARARERDPRITLVD